MISHRLTPFLVASLTLPLAATGCGRNDTTPAACTLDTATAEAARAAMEREGLIREGDEPDFGDVAIRWTAVSTVMHEEACLVAMQACTMVDGEPPTDCQMLEVVGRPLDEPSEADRFGTFESVLDLDPATETVRVKVQLGSGYYTDLTGASAIAARKAVAVDIRTIEAFLGWVVVEDPPDWDPTPDRRWRLLAAEYDLRRGATGETMDIQAVDWDVDPEGFYAGAIYDEVDGQTAALVGPWGNYLALVVDEAGTTDVDERALLCESVDPADSAGLPTDSQAPCESASLLTVLKEADQQRDLHQTDESVDIALACVAAWCHPEGG